MGMGGLPLIHVCGGSPRPILKPVGPIDFEFNRTDYPVSPENPVEIHTLILEQKWSPRPVLRLIGPIIFFADRKEGGRGVPIFLAVGVADHDEGSGRSFSGMVSC